MTDNLVRDRTIVAGDRAKQCIDARTAGAMGVVQSKNSTDKLPDAQAGTGFRSLNTIRAAKCCGRATGQRNLRWTYGYRCTVNRTHRGGVNPMQRQYLGNCQGKAAVAGRPSDPGCRNLPRKPKCVFRDFEAGTLVAEHDRWGQLTAVKMRCVPATQKPTAGPRPAVQTHRE